MSGVQLQLLIGPVVPVPAPTPVMEALESVEVVHSAEGPSAFQISFRFRREGGMVGMAAEVLLALPIFKVFSRVVLTVTFKSIPHVIMDGIVLNQQLQPGGEPGSVRFTLTGEDVSIMMDRHDVNAAHPMQNDVVIANKLILKYAQYGLIPLVIPPAMLNLPLPTDPPPTQNTTDYKYLQDLASRYNYDFYITPGPAPLANLAYWGPKIRVGIPQKALTVDMGFATNVSNLSFEHNAAEPTTVQGQVMDKTTGVPLPVLALTSFQIPLASLPTLTTNITYARRETVRDSGSDYVQALALAQGRLERSTNEVLTGSGEVDVLKYDGVLRARGLVGVRGAGLLYDGFYYVKRVTHSLQRGSYQQRFTIAREGLGTTTPVVLP